MSSLHWVLLITGLLLLGGRPSRNVAAAYRYTEGRAIDQLPSDEAWVDVSAATQTPALPAPFCTQVGLEQLVTFGSFTAVSGLASSCFDGHAIAMRALLEAGLQSRDDVIKLKSVVALRGPIANLRRRDAELAGTCASALLALVRAEDTFVVNNAIIALGDIAIRFSVVDGPLAARCMSSMVEAACGGNHARLQAVHTLAKVALRTKRDSSGTAMLCVALLEQWGFAGDSGVTKMHVVDLLAKIAVGARDNAEDGLAARSIAALTGRCLDDSDIRGYTLSMMGTVVHGLRRSQARLVERCVAALSEKACGDDGADSDDEARPDRWTGLGVIGGVAVRMARDPSNGVFDKCVSVLSDRGMRSSSRGVVLRAIRVIVKVIDDVYPINATLASACFHVLWSARAHEDWPVRDALQNAFSRYNITNRSA